MTALHPRRLAVANIVTSFFFISTLPLRIAFEDNQTLTVHQRSHALPLPPLPEGRRPGSMLASLTPDTRTALAIEAHLGRLPAGKTYILPVVRAGAVLQVPVTSIDAPTSFSGLAFDSAAAFTWTLLAAISLLLIWRGRDLAAWGMALWGISYVFGVANRDPHADGLAGLGVQGASFLLYALARVGFYLMADALVARVLAPRVLAAFRIGFALLLVASAPSCT